MRHRINAVASHLSAHIALHQTYMLEQSRCLYETLLLIASAFAQDIGADCLQSSRNREQACYLPVDVAVMYRTQVAWPARPTMLGR